MCYSLGLCTDCGISYQNANKATARHAQNVMSLIQFALACSYVLNIVFPLQATFSSVDNLYCKQFGPDQAQQHLNGTNEKQAFKIYSFFNSPDEKKWVDLPSKTIACNLSSCRKV